MTETPKIYAAIHAVLSALQVEKNGMLPGNMGGKAYMTAEDISNEVKRLFVTNKIAFEANEDVAHIVTPDFDDKKMRFLVTITGKYRAIHIEDGSSITFSGTGQGLATGTAVAANIASTFALKNALQRQFLISEAAVDADGLREQAVPKQNPAQQAAQAKAAPAKAAAPKGADEANKAAGAEIAKRIQSGTYDKDHVNDLLNKLIEETGKPKAENMAELLKRLENGEVA